MSRGLNKVQIIGNLGNDPEMRYTPQGSPVTNFKVATGGKWTDRNGVERDDTEWFRVEAWDRLAEICNQYLAKGRQVYVEGRLKTRKYTDQSGVERYITEVVANNVVLLGTGGRAENRADDEYGEEDEYEMPASPPPREQQPPASTGRAGAPRQGQGGRRNQPQPVSNQINDDEIPF